MLPEKIIAEALEIAMSTGADFAELFSEKTRNNSIRFCYSAFSILCSNTLGVAYVKGCDHLARSVGEEGRLAYQLSALGVVIVAEVYSLGYKVGVINVLDFSGYVAV